MFAYTAGVAAVGAGGVAWMAAAGWPHGVIPAALAVVGAFLSRRVARLMVRKPER
jgi:hypothetical protein